MLRMHLGVDISHPFRYGSLAGVAQPACDALLKAERRDVLVAWDTFLPLRIPALAYCYKTWRKSV
jgi:hypothetical protein